MNAPTSTPSDTATRVWTAMQQLVTENDRRRALRNALELGTGKVEALIKLLDGPMTLREIARALEIDPPAATVGVDQLERRGLVNRAPHPDNKRSKLVHLTDAGREAASRGQAILNQPPPALTELPPDDLALLDRILTELTRDTGSSRS